MRKLSIIIGAVLFGFGLMASPAMAGCFDDPKSSCRVRIDTDNGELVVHAPQRDGIWGTGGVAIVTVSGQENGIWGTGGTAIPGVEVKVTIPAD